MSKRKNKTAAHPGFDYVLLASVLGLSAIGLIMVLSSSSLMAEKFWSNKYYFFEKQVVFTLLGLLVMSFFMYFPVRLLTRLKYVWLILVFALLILSVVSPWQVESGGASRWVSLGGVGLQPLEAAKAGLVIYLAYFFANKQHLVKTFSVGFLPPSVITGAMCVLLLLQPDFGGAVFLAGLLFFMSLIGGTRLMYLFPAAVLAVATGTAMIINSPYRFKRWFVFLDPFKDPSDSGYQLVQSLYGLGAGGVWGRGLGEGRQKLFFLPEAHNDFILAVLGEELGFIGISIVFLLLGLWMWRAFKISLDQDELEKRFLGCGLGLVVTLAALLNMAVVLGAVPPKGVAMPFISYGGSSLLISFFCAGVLLNLSRRKRC
ncbi:MAG: putative lipid II flippase FtsW [Desulfonatronovibrionaceae bacterium]